MRLFWYLALLVLIGGGVWFFFSFSSTSPETITPSAQDAGFDDKPAAPNDKNQTTYSNTAYGVSLNYPDSWRPDQPSGIAEGETPISFAGDDGFFSIDALGDKNDSLDKAVRSLVTNRLEPYGSNPTVVKTQIAGQEAVFIFPSDDQPPEARSEAVLLVRYAEPVIIEILPGSTETYGFFALYASKDYIDSIGRTLSFAK